MSWSISVVGSSGDVIEALRAKSLTLSGEAKVEYDAALPHLIGLAAQNFAAPGFTGSTIDLTASGSGFTAADGVQRQRTCGVSINPSTGAPAGSSRVEGG